MISLLSRDKLKVGSFKAHPLWNSTCNIILEKMKQSGLIFQHRFFRKLTWHRHSSRYADGPAWTLYHLFRRMRRSSLTCKCKHSRVTCFKKRCYKVKSGPSACLFECRFYLPNRRPYGFLPESWFKYRKFSNRGAPHWPQTCWVSGRFWPYLNQKLSDFHSVKSHWKVKMSSL